ncbi:VOC family protein [Cupriavidus sp. CV2]|uniref:VOC family protein n=1 Tax=Cupriavidus ulmosensis TaxID=3065913 RepID=UPI00296B543F|nr:VOC family protein [Cupriavidus sp. CV2]MDW3688234.1 VOC family protein [Cupriavidus sp. CV2]
MPRPGLAFSHVGFYVTNLAVMEDFYTRVFEFTVTDRGQLPGSAGPVDLVFLSRDPDEHHQIVLISGRPQAISFNVINQISLKADSLPTLKTIYRRVGAEPLVSEITPVTHGNSLSVYVRDPEGNRLELYMDLPWYVSQPLRLPVDLSLDDATIMVNAEAHARSLPGFKTRLEWRAEMARRMDLNQFGETIQ